MAGEKGKSPVTDKQMIEALDGVAKTLDGVASSYIVIAMADNDDLDMGLRVHGDVDELLALNARFTAALYAKANTLTAPVSEAPPAGPDQVDRPEVG